MSRLYDVEGGTSVEAWEAAELEYGFEERVEAEALYQTSLAALVARMHACRKAEDRFRKAYADILNARGELVEAIGLVEDTMRLVSLRRGT